MYLPFTKLPKPPWKEPADGGGPTLLEAKTYRIKGHFVGDPEMYRTKEEVQEQFDSNDPLKNFKQAVLTTNSLTEKTWKKSKLK